MFQSFKPLGYLYLILEMKSSVINHKSTRRGCRAGAYKQRNVSVVIGNRPETSERKTYENIDEGIIKDNKIT